MNSGLALTTSMGLHAITLAFAVILPTFAAPQWPPTPPAPSPPVTLLVNTVGRSSPPQRSGGTPPARTSPGGRRQAARETPTALTAAVGPDSDRRGDPADIEAPPCLADCGSLPEVDVPGPPAGTGLPAAPVGPVSVGPSVRAPARIRHVTPIYPEWARRVGVQGTVVIECVLDRAGRVSEAAVLTGHPLLDAAALEAVRQWTYVPTLLNGVPVAVRMTVTVRFVLATPRVDG